MPELLSRKQYLEQSQERIAAFHASVQPVAEVHAERCPAAPLQGESVNLTLVDTQSAPPAAPPALRPALRTLPPEQEVKGGFIFIIEIIETGKRVILCGEAADVDLWRMQHPGVDYDVPVYRGAELLAIAKDGCPGPFVNEAKSVFGGRLLMDDEAVQKAGCK